MNALCSPGITSFCYVFWPCWSCVLQNSRVIANPPCGNKDLEIQIRDQDTVMLQPKQEPASSVQAERRAFHELAILTGLRRQCFGYDKMVSVRQPQTMSASLSGRWTACRLIVSKHNVLLFWAGNTPWIKDSLPCCWGTLICLEEDKRWMIPLMIPKPNVGTSI